MDFLGFRFLLVSIGCWFGVLLSLCFVVELSPRLLGSLGWGLERLGCDLGCHLLNICDWDLVHVFHVKVFQCLLANSTQEHYLPVESKPQRLERHPVFFCPNIADVPDTSWWLDNIQNLFAAIFTWQNNGDLVFDCTTRVHVLSRAITRPLSVRNLPILLSSRPTSIYIIYPIVFMDIFPSFYLPPTTRDVTDVVNIDTPAHRCFSVQRSRCLSRKRVWWKAWCLALGSGVVSRDVEIIMCNQ